MVILFFSCTKEVSREQDNDTPIIDTSGIGQRDTILLTENGGLLKRLVAQYDGEKDSLIYNLKYDNESRLIEYYGVTSGNQSDNDMHSLLLQFHRNDKGLVDEIKLQTYFFDVSGNPSIHWDANYKIKTEVFTSRYLYALVTGVGENYLIADSISYEYGSDNHLSTVSIYNLQENDTAHLNDRFSYIFNTQGNISVRKASYVRNYPDREDWFINELTYDDKINPMNFGEEMLLIGDIVFASLPTVNNPTVQNNTINIDESFTIQYNYNVHNKPSTAIWKYNDGEAIKFKYYYSK